MSPPEQAWTNILPVSRCAAGKATSVSIEDHALVVFHLKDPERFIVADGCCPHAGADLAAGRVDGNLVTCPWHAWSFDLDTGRCITGQPETLRRHESRVEAGVVQARLTPPQEPPDMMA
ncbi:MAG: Rieske 2Fe-2S domain-containing protein [bacterium]|nr:Rieske 2Fe-2S domain-containing protein [bacterium]